MDFNDQKEYCDFLIWTKKENVEIMNEMTLKWYFNYLHSASDLDEELIRPTVLWAIFYSLRKVLLKEKNIDIDQYKNLQNDLRIKTKNYNSRAYNSDKLIIFLNESPNNEYLQIKVKITIILY